MWEVAGSIIGQMMAQKKYDEIAKLRQEAMDRYGNTNLSTLESLAKEQLGPSKLGNVQMDAKYKSTQDAALDKLMGISNAGGMDAQSVNKLNQAKQAAFGVERGMRGAAEQSLARRGMLDSGAMVSSALGSAQGGVDRAYQGSLQTASDASERALQALMAGGNMAGKMGQDDLAQKNRVAGADDRISQFNLENRMGGERDVLNAKLRIADGMNGTGNQQANDLGGAAQREQSMWRGIGVAGDTTVDRAKSLYDEWGAQQTDPVTGQKKRDPNGSGDEHNGQDW